MDPVTHALIGAAIYKVSGGQISISDPASMAAIVGAMAPDFDIVFRRWGQFSYLKNHRGITHSIIGLTGLSAVLTVMSVPFYGSASLAKIFLFALLGCFSHTFFDMLNSYGARVFWPFIKRKIALNVLVLFDPIVFGLLLGIILSNKAGTIGFLNVLIAYIFFRVASKFSIVYMLSKSYNVEYRKIKVIPWVMRLEKWLFVIRFDDYSIVGEKDVFKSGITILRRLTNLDSNMKKRALETKVGKFFTDFTPMYNVNYESKEGENIFTFTDIRHYVSNSFLHHATVKFTEDFNIKEQIIHPYSLSRNIYL